MIRNAIILAGGFGTRLSPLKDERPKPLMPVNNEPLLQAHLRRLAKAGVKQVRVSLHHGADMIEAAIRKMDQHGMKVSTSREKEKPLGTAGAIKSSCDFPASEACYVLNGDIVTNLPLEEVGAFHESRGADATLWGIPVQDTSAYGVLETGEEGRIRRFLEKPLPGQSASKVVNAGVYVLGRALVDLIPPGMAVSIERETFPLALERGLKLFAFVKEAYWVDIGTPQSYLRANLDANKGRSVLGPGCVVAPDALVEDSVLLEGCEVAGGARIKRAILGRFCKIGKGARVEDQVLAENSSVMEGGHA